MGCCKAASRYHKRQLRVDGSEAGATYPVEALKGSSSSLCASANPAGLLGAGVLGKPDPPPVHRQRVDAAPHT
jgi:hypothetical protein